MNENKTILILSTQAYKFIDENSGETREGTSIHYVLPKIENGERFLYGHRVTKSSIDKNIKFVKVPGLYISQTELIQNSKGLSLKIVGLEYLKAVELPFK